MPLLMLMGNKTPVLLDLVRPRGTLQSHPAQRRPCWAQARLHPAIMWGPWLKVIIWLSPGITCTTIPKISVGVCLCSSSRWMPFCLSLGSLIAAWAAYSLTKALSLVPWISMEMLVLFQGAKVQCVHVIVVSCVCWGVTLNFLDYLFNEAKGVLSAYSTVLVVCAHYGIHALYALWYDIRLVGRLNDSLPLPLAQFGVK